MSKKLEALKEAVFYSEQKPEILAGYLANLVSDVATSIEIFGADSIEIPASDSTTSDYTAKVVSQFGDYMTGTPTLALDESVTGVSISSGTVTVASTVEADSFVIKATSGTVVAKKTVTLVPAN